MPSEIVLTNDKHYNDIASAIRNKNGLSTLYKPSEMAEAINALVVGGTITLQDKTVNPSEETQTITHDTGYMGLGEVTVTPILTEVKTVTENGNVYPTTGKYLTRVTVNVPQGGGEINNQNKSVTPTESQQSVTYDDGYTGLGTVTVGAISSTYVGSGITQRSSTDLTASGATVTVPAGNDDLLTFVQPNRFSGSTFYNSEITYVKSYAFYNVRATSVDLPNCVSIDNSAFWGAGISYVSLPKCEYIGSYAFSGIKQLKELSLPVCSYLAGGALTGLNSMLSLFLGSTSIYIGNYAISRRYVMSLVSSTVHATFVGTGAFQLCSRISSLNLPILPSVGQIAFGNCTNLAVVSLPICSYISSAAFSGCYKLLSVYLLSTSVCSLPYVNAFSSTPISNYTTSTGGVYGSIYVPSSLLASYKAATN